MILHFSKQNQNKIHEFAPKYEAIIIEKNEELVFITPSRFKEVPELEKIATKVFVTQSDIQLSDIKYRPKREIKIGKHTIGGESRKTLLIAGPCSIESEEQIEKSSELLIKNNLSNLRAGAFKPRTSPYTFQGLGLEGLKLLAKMRQKYGFSIFTEVRDASQIDMILEYADVVQIGAKSMYDHGILKRCAKTEKTILLKRHFGASIQEFVQAAEFILSGGNENVILCERGIRTFETKTRFSLDLCGVSYLKEYTNLPIILDPSHAMGYSYGVPDLARACMAMDIDGLLIETHPNPKVAKSDASQQLTHEEFEKMLKTLKPIAEAVGREVV